MQLPLFSSRFIDGPLIRRAPLTIVGAVLWVLSAVSAIGAEAVYSSPSSVMSITMYLREDPAVGELRDSLRASTETLSRRERYERGRTFLTQISERTQAGLRRFLDSLIAGGERLSYRTHWIDNCVTVVSSQEALASVVAHPDALGVRTFPTLETLPPTPEGERSEYGRNERDAENFGVESNLTAIDAPAVWALGFTGRGRVVCTFDTGIEGGHPALRDSWRGWHADASSAWFDPVDGDSQPHVFEGPVTYSHGTAVLGVILGRDTISGDTIGVAPGAEWISAAVIDIPGASIVDAFEWAADPDRDPNSIEDVPDVINHSWGIPTYVMGCEDLFWRLIDNTEALGIVNIFAAGNEGAAGAQTVRNPANRARDSVDCFAIGSADLSDSILTRAVSSSKGPSGCDGVSIKPNALAPGVSIRTSVPHGQFEHVSGTSFSAPHATGIVALLREKNPDASAQAIKRALLASAEDLGELGPDNDNGWGLVNALSSLEALSPSGSPRLRVWGLNPSSVDSVGDLASRVTLINNGGAVAANARLHVFAVPSGATLLSGDIDFGDIAPGDTLTGVDPIRAHVTPVFEGTVVTMSAILSADQFSDTVPIHALVGPRVTHQFHTHITDRVKFTVSNFGEYGFAPGSYTPLGYDGFSYDNDPRANTLFEMALVIATDSTHVSDGARNASFEPDRDFAVAPGGSLRVTSDSLRGVEESHAVFIDTLAEWPLGLAIIQSSRVYTREPYNDFVTLEYVLTNTQESPLVGAHVALFADWDIVTSSRNQAGFSPLDHFGYVYYSDADTQSWRGIVVLGDPGMTGHYVADMYEVGAVRNPFTEGLKYLALSAAYTKAVNATESDLAHFVSAGPYALAPGDSTRVAFAIVGGNTLWELTDAARRARHVYDSLDPPPVDPGPTRPFTWRLSQNYPNPFNGETAIEYEAADAGLARLTVYDALGRKVRVLQDGSVTRGPHATSWDGRDDHGRVVASGVYFYALMTGDVTLKRKMAFVR